MAVLHGTPDSSLEERKERDHASHLQVAGHARHRARPADGDTRQYYCQRSASSNSHGVSYRFPDDYLDWHRLLPGQCGSHSHRRVSQRSHWHENDFSHRIGALYHRLRAMRDRPQPAILDRLPRFPGHWWRSTITHWYGDHLSPLWTHGACRSNLAIDDSPVAWAGFWPCAWGLPGNEL